MIVGGEKVDRTACEKTFEAMEKEGVLAFPVIAVNEALTKLLQVRIHGSCGGRRGNGRFATLSNARRLLRAVDKRRSREPR